MKEISGFYFLWLQEIVIITDLIYSKNLEQLFILFFLIQNHKGDVSKCAKVNWKMVLKLMMDTIILYLKSFKTLPVVDSFALRPHDSCFSLSFSHSDFAAQTQCEKVNEFNNTQQRDAHKKPQKAAARCNKVSQCVSFCSVQRNKVVFFEW